MWESLGFFRPPEHLPIDVRGQGDVYTGGPLRILSWNLQFCAGRRGWFFYDGGPDSRVERAEVERTIEGVAELIRRHDPDVVLLQEVDRRSTRTHEVDQHEALRERLGLPVDASTPYFRVPYVPVPPHAPLGRVDMHLSVFSRFQLKDGVRHRLSALQEPRVRRAFNLRRCVMSLQLGPLRLLHTHLSAFSRGDGTLKRQVDRLMKLSDEHAPLFLTGDLNSLPPGEDAKRLGAAHILYDEPTPIAPLFDTLERLSPTTGSYVPWGSNLPDRTIDYAFGRGLRAERATFIAEGATLSDHLPLVVDVQPRG